MKKLTIALLAALLLTSCGTSHKVYNLYNWGEYYNYATEYEHLSYNNYKKLSPESLCALLCLYEQMVTSPGGDRQVPPPGICAEYGYMLFQPETASTFANTATDNQKKVFGVSGDYSSFFRERAQKMFEMEVANYPESAKFLEPIIKKIK